MILLFSGGPDCLCAYEYLNKPQTLYVALGHRYMNQEILAAKLLIPNTIIDTSLHLGSWEQEDAFIPLRNIFLAMIASNYSDIIVLVTQKGELDLKDRSIKFFQDISETLSYYLERKIIVYSPFIDMTKTQMVKWYIDNGFPIDRLKMTRSCYATTDKPCGECAACFRRWVAFSLNNIHEDYEHDITKWSGIKGYIKRDWTDEQRKEETFKALRRGNFICR